MREGPHLAQGSHVVLKGDFLLREFIKHRRDFGDANGKETERQEHKTQHVHPLEEVHGGHLSSNDQWVNRGWRILAKHGGRVTEALFPCTFGCSNRVPAALLWGWWAVVVQ